jgi:hypothetical protein
VVDEVPDHGIAGGNPARLLRRRYSDADINRLLALAWWDRPLGHITEHLRAIMSGSIDDLENAAPTPMIPSRLRHLRAPAPQNRAICLPLVPQTGRRPSDRGEVTERDTRLGVTSGPDPTRTARSARRPVGGFPGLSVRPLL